jgi:hypothetical protein
VIPVSKLARRKPFPSTSIEVMLPTGKPSLVIAVGAKLSDSCVMTVPSPMAPIVMSMGPPATFTWKPAPA